MLNGRNIDYLSIKIHHLEVGDDHGILLGLKAQTKKVYVPKSR